MRFLGYGIGHQDQTKAVPSDKRTNNAAREVHCLVIPPSHLSQRVFTAVNQTNQDDEMESGQSESDESDTDSGMDESDEENYF